MLQGKEGGHFGSNFSHCRKTKGVPLPYNSRVYLIDLMQDKFKEWLKDKDVAAESNKEQE